MELQVLEQVVPVVKFNKEELKVALQGHLDKYSNLVVTAETEKDCKKAKAELGKLETAIETFHKDTKRLLSEPITQFEKDCKELVALIQDVKKPIDTQLKEIEEHRKAEKESVIREEIEKIVIEYELDDKYSAQIQINSTWLNKSTSMSKITTEIKNLAETLKIAQMSVSKNREVIKSTCAIYSGKLKQPLDYEVWMERLDEGQDIATLLEKIHEVGKQRLAAELEEQEREAREILNRPETEPIIHEEPIKPIYTPKVDDPIMSATIKLYGTQEQFKAFKNIMASIGMHYEIIK